MTNNHEHEHAYQDESIVVLTDEEGNDVEFQYITTLERDGDEYIVLMLLDDEAEDDEGEVVILKIQTDDDGEDFYVSIEDDELYDSLFEEFVELVENEDDEDEDY